METIKRKASILAEQETLHHVLNCYLRETGIHDPRIDKRMQNEGMFFTEEVEREEEAFLIHLLKSDTRLVGTFKYWSFGGHHIYGEQFLYKKDAQHYQTATYLQVIELLLIECSLLEQDRTIRLEKRERLRTLMENSIAKTKIYIKNAFQSRENQDSFILSEQSLLFGHPFHPIAKSSEGFSEDDLFVYTPELQTAFSLHYFAVHPDFIEEFDLESKQSWFNEEVKQYAGKKADSYRLLPLHPWQAIHLLEFEEVKNLINNKNLINLGPIGPQVYPTSSVRTVWEKEQNVFYKLPLSIRLTNFVRINTKEQVARSIDASRVIEEVRNEVENDQFRLLVERGYKALSIIGKNEKKNEELFSASAVLLREGSSVFTSEGENTFVVGSLLERDVVSQLPKLIMYLNQHKLETSAKKLAWFRAYAQITFVPLLTLFVEQGISLEAHAQNTLIRLKDGVPLTFIVRDVEGASISTARATENGWINQIIYRDSPVLYDENEAWERFVYYFIVNHLQYVIAILAKHSLNDERDYWQVVKEILMGMEVESKNERLKRYLSYVFTKKTFPAKANMLSSFHKTGEKPLYVDIPNPFVFLEEDIDE